MSTTLTSKKIRLAADVASLNAPADVLTGLTPAFYRGNDLRVEFAVMSGGVLMDVGSIASVTLEIKAGNEEGAPPAPTDAVLMTKTIGSASLNAALTLSEWNTAAGQHGVLEFSAQEANISAGNKWLSLWVMTSDNPGKVITLAAGTLKVLEDGSSGGVQTPPVPIESYYTSTQSDARYLLAGQNFSDVASPAAARLNLGLGSAATVNTGTVQGTLPVLGVGGKLDSALLPAVDTGVLAPRGGVRLNSGWISIPALTLGKSDFDFLFLLKRAAWGGEQTLIGGLTGAPSLRFAADNTLIFGVVGVGDTLQTTARLLTDAPTWVRLRRGGGQTKIYLNEALCGTVADSLNYTGAVGWLGACDSSGTAPFLGSLMSAACFNRALDDGEVYDYKEAGGADIGDRWGSTSNIYSAASLVVGKRVYLKTGGSESITINGQVYKDGTSGSIDASAGVEVVVASSSITNGLTSSSTLRYVGQLWELDCTVGCGYQLHDRSANGLHGLLSESGWEHSVKRRDWQLAAVMSAGGYIGGAARAVLPAGHIIERVYTIGGAGITLSLGETNGTATIVNGSVCGAGVVDATVATARSGNHQAYVTYNSGSGNVAVLLKGCVE